MASGIKFLQASDFHLEQPIVGLDEIPNHLKPTLANATYDAATRLFDLAEREAVDFILLAGDLIDLNTCGPRAAAFLLAQFERMANCGITIYWCGGSTDQPDRWPSGIELPNNVVTFTTSLVEQTEHVRDGKVMATICGSGYDSRKRNPSDFFCENTTPFPIALLHGHLDLSSITAQNIRYWALGGSHKKQFVEKHETVLVQSGTVQSRSPLEPGSYGCYLVNVAADGRIKIQERDLDSVRWTRQKLTVAESASEDDLKNVISDRIQKIRAESGDRTVLCIWKVTATGEFDKDLRNESSRTEIIQWLRHEFGQSSAGVWTVDLAIDPPKSLPSAWHEEETILGDYLRAVGRFQNDPSMALALNQQASIATQDDSPISDIAIVEGSEREATLKQAALIGVDYLAANDTRDISLD